jgi:two-component system, sensor histidine kinase and response regulator
MANLLIADDERINRMLLRAYLAESGHQIHEAASGNQALEIAASTPIDLALLDVLMPGMDGFETTRRLKAAHANRFLPIVLVTALSDQPSRRLGLLAGADEFLTKPVDPEELLLRVRNMLALRDAQAALLEENVAHVELHRFREEMISMLVHDLKNPLGALLLNLDLARGAMGKPVAVEALDDAIALGDRLHALIKGMLEVQRQESARLRLQGAELDVHAIVAPIHSARRWQIERHGIAFEMSCLTGCTVEADAFLLTRVIENLLDNALRHTPSGGRIVLSGQSYDDRIALRFGNTGTPIPAHLREHVFEKHGQAGERGGRANLGLGLYFCRAVANAHGGRIWVEETPELSTVFVFEIPRRRAELPDGGPSGGR